MKKTKKILFFLIIFTYLASRSLVILNFPLFFDEAIYIRWAQYAVNDGYWFISLIDGKQPLFIWLTAMSLEIFSDPMIAGRFVSAIAGLGSLLAIYLIGKKLFSTRIGLFAALIFTLLPFSLIYNSLSLMDSLLFLFFVWAEYFLILFTEKLSWKYAIAFGFAAGLGLLTKTSAYFLFISGATAIVFVPFQKNKIMKWSGLLALSLIIAKLIESIMRFSEYFNVVGGKNSLFMVSLPEFIASPFKAFINNFPLAASWLVGYLTLPLILIFIMSLALKINRRIKIFLVLNFLVPTLLTVFIGKQLYPRHIFFLVWPVIILAATGLEKLKTYFKLKIFVPLVYGVIFIPLLVADFGIIQNYTFFSMPEIDVWQFVNGPPSGSSVKPAVSYLKTVINPNKKTLVLTDQFLGILPEGISIYFSENKNVEFYGLNGITKKKIELQMQDTQPQETFLIFSWQGIPTDLNIKFLKEFKRAGKTNVNWKIFRYNP